MNIKQFPYFRTLKYIFFFRNITVGKYLVKKLTVLHNTIKIISYFLLAIFLIHLKALFNPKNYLLMKTSTNTCNFL